MTLIRSDPVAPKLGLVEHRRPSRGVALAVAPAALAVTATVSPLVAIGASFVLLLVIAAVRPEVGLFAVVFLTFTNAASVLSEFHHLPSPTEPLLVATAAGLLARPRATAAAMPSPVPWVLPLFVLLATVRVGSSFWAVDPTRVVTASVDHAKDLAVVALVMLTVRSAHHLRVAVWAVVAAGGFMAAVTVVKYASGNFVADFGGFGQASVEQIVGSVDDWRIRGPFDDPNFFAQVLAMILPLSVERAIRDPSLVLRLVAAMTSPLLVLAVVFTFSRGGFVALAVLVVAGGILLRPAASTLIVSGLLVVALVATGPPGFGERLGTITEAIPLVGDGAASADTDASIRGRTSEITVGWRMFLDHPLAGVGFANYPVLYQDYSRTLELDPRREEREPHNLYLEVAAETGVVGLAAFAALVVPAFASLVALRRRVAESSVVSMGSGVLLALVVWVITSLFLHAAYGRIQWTLVGLAFAAAALHPPASDREPARC